MSNSTTEVCQIRKITRNKSGWASIIPLFGNLQTENFWIAEATTEKGVICIAKSKTWSNKIFLEEDEVGRLRSEREESVLHQQLLQTFLSNGWKPTGTDQNGRIMALSREREAIQVEEYNTSNLSQQNSILHEDEAINQDILKKKRILVGVFSVVVLGLCLVCTCTTVLYYLYSVSSN